MYKIKEKCMKTIIKITIGSKVSLVAAREKNKVVSDFLLQRHNLQYFQGIFTSQINDNDIVIISI